MKKLYCVNCSKYRKFEKPKISYLFKCKNEDAEIFMEQESIEKILKILGVINNIEEFQKYLIILKKT